MAQKGKSRIGLNNIISWGASVVIIGLMAKLMHLPWGDWMIVVGLGTEALLFFLLGFQKEAPEAETVAVAGPSNAGASNALDKLLQQGDVNPELIGRLGDGLRSFGDKVKAISDVSDVSLATNQFTASLKSTSDGFNRLNESFERVSQDLAKIGNTNVDTSSYQEQISRLAGNLQQLNKMYEQEMQQSDQKMKAITDHYENISRSLQSFTDSTADTQQLKEQIQTLNKNLASLNAVYANMLAAMNQPRV